MLADAGSWADEGPVDLEHVDRALDQRGQRREPRAEVVGGELDAEVAQARQRRARLVAALDDGPLRDLDAEGASGEPGGVEIGLELLGQERVVEALG
jgi:hypothetical protein